MKAFLQNRRTKEFYGGPQRVATKARALDHRSAANAERIARREELREVSIILTFNQGKETIVLPLGAKIGLRDASDRKT